MSAKKEHLIDSYRSTGTVAIPITAKAGSERVQPPQDNLSPSRASNNSPMKTYRSQGSLLILNPSEDSKPSHRLKKKTSQSERDLSTLEPLLVESDEPASDDNMEVIRKKADKVEQVQNMFIKYLKPQPLAPPGDLIISQEPDVQLPAEPPLRITQNPPEDDIKKVVLFILRAEFQKN